VQVAQGRQKRNYDKRNSVDNNIFEDGEKVLLMKLDLKVLAS
jgi:hypothetical protein